MHRRGVVDQRLDAMLGQQRRQLVALRMPHHEQVPGRTRGLGVSGGQHQPRQPLQAQPVGGGNVGTAAVVTIQRLQLLAQEGRLQLVHAGIEACQLVDILPFRPVVAQHAHATGQRIVVGRHRPGVAQRTQVLARVEAEAGRMSQAAAALPMMGGAVCLCCVFQHRQAVPFGNGQDRLHVHGTAIQMHHCDGAGTGRDGRSQRIRIQAGVVRSRLHRHRRGPRVAHGQPGGNVGVAGHDHFITRADSPASQRQLQGIQPVAHRDAVLHAAVGRKGCLEGCRFFAQQHPAAVHHPLEGFAEGQTMTLIDGLQVQEGDGGCSIHERTGA